MDIKKYIYGHCVSPTSVKVWDAYSSQFVVREFPCGKCLHCRNTRINDWCTRLVAQKKYSRYCYYVSLDYAPFEVTNADAMQLARETAACYHAINKNQSFGLHPLVLCKNHLQDFYKRLRKNTKIKLQYFACGEYGMHANGRGYGRPHFHNIIFSDTPISLDDFTIAWSVNGYFIGRVDLVDLSSNDVGDKNNLTIFKYVCKYLQKSGFDFESLATIDYHRSYFKSMQYVIKKATDLFSEDKKVPITDPATLAFNWSEYTKLYSPFVVCSRRPSIGSAYLAENLERFKDSDFRLFGLPDICSTFPRYYVRRAKEASIDFRCIGEDSKVPVSPSRMGYIVQVLHKLQNYSTSVDRLVEKSKINWSIYKDRSSGDLKLYCKELTHSIPVSSLSFYDVKNKFMYQFDGYTYNVWAKMSDKSYYLIDNMAICDVLREITPSWNNYYHKFVKPAHDFRVLSEHELYDSICVYYPADNFIDSYDKFKKDVYDIYQSELADSYKTKLLMSNSKQTL